MSNSAFNRSLPTSRRQNANTTLNIACNTLAYVFAQMGLPPLDRRGRDVERDLESTLATFRAYRRRDPEFEAAIGAVAKAEAQHATSDPVEGHFVIGRLVDGQLVEDAGSVQREIRQLLHG